MTSPVFRQLKMLYPHSSIDALCEKRNRVLLEENPNIRHCFELNRGTSTIEFIKSSLRLRANKYDLSIDLQGLPKTAVFSRLVGAKARYGFKARWLRNRLCYTHPFTYDPNDYSATINLKLLQDPRIDLDDIQLDFYTKSTPNPIVDGILKSARARKLIAINPMTRFENRRWPIANYAALIRKLHHAGYCCVILFGPGEEQTAQQLATCSRTDCIYDYSILDLAALKQLLEQCDLFVGNDGGPRHIAIAAKTPTVSIMISPDQWTPPGSTMHQVITIDGAAKAANGLSVPGTTALSQIPLSTVLLFVFEELLSTAGHRRVA